MLATLAGVSVLGVAVLAWHYRGSQSAGRFDQAVYGPLADIGDQHEPLLWKISQLGGPLMLVLGTASLVVLAARTRGRAAVLLALLGPTLAILVTEFVLKPLIGRLHDGELALPSGHTTSIAALASVVMVLFVVGDRGLPWWARVGLALGSVAAVLAVAVSMVAAARHYAADTVAGALVSISVVILLALLLDVTAGKRSELPEA